MENRGIRRQKMSGAAARTGKENIKQKIKDTNRKRKAGVLHI